MLVKLGPGYWGVQRVQKPVPYFPRASERRDLLIVGVCQTFSHLHIFKSSHLLILTSSRIQILTSSHLLTFTSAHLHSFIFTSSHPHTFSSSHPHILTSSHLLIFTSAHLHICLSSHLLIFPSSHLLIFTSSHLLIFAFSLAPLLSCPLALFVLLRSPSFLFFSRRRGAVPTRRHETQPFRTKWGSIAKSCGKIAICKASGATLSHEMRFDRQKLR